MLILSFLVSLCFRIGIAAERGFFGGWDLDYVLVSEHQNEDELEKEAKDQEDENVVESRERVWKFVASTKLDDKQNFIDLYSVVVSKEGDKLKDPDVDVVETTEEKPSGETSPSKGFGIGLPKMGFSWKSKSGDKEPGYAKDVEDVIVPEEELEVESASLEIESALKHPDGSQHKHDKNWKFGIPSFSLGRRTSSPSRENVDDDDREVSETVPEGSDDILEEDDSEKKRYTVKVKTADKFTAGTSSIVYIYLFGENGDSSKCLHITLVVFTTRVFFFCNCLK